MLKLLLTFAWWARTRDHIRVPLGVRKSETESSKLNNHHKTIEKNSYRTYCAGEKKTFPLKFHWWFCSLTGEHSSFLSPSLSLPSLNLSHCPNSLYLFLFLFSVCFSSVLFASGLTPASLVENKLRAWKPKRGKNSK